MPPVQTDIVENTSIQSILDESTQGTEQLIIDEARERYYSAFTEQLEQTDAQNLSWHLDIWLNSAIKRGIPNKITTSDLGPISVNCTHPAVEELSKAFGYNFRRPLFFTDIPTVRTIRQKITGINAPSEGITIAPSGFDPISTYRGNQPLPVEGISLIIAGTNNPAVIRHELIHSIDPHLATRRQKDRILAEIAATYAETYLPTTIISVTTTDKGSYTKQEERVSSLPFIESSLIHSFDTYGTGYENEAEYVNAIERVFAIIVDLEQHQSKEQVNIAILNSKSIQEFENKGTQLHR